MSYFSGASWVWAFCFGFRKKKYREHWYICWQLLIPRRKTSIQKYIFKSFLRILECLKLLICIFHDKLENLHLLIYLRLSNSLSLSIILHEYDSFPANNFNQSYFSLPNAEYKWFKSEFQFSHSSVSTLSSITMEHYTWEIMSLR